MIKLNKAEIDWIKAEFESGQTVSEISISTGISISNVKRALAEAGVMKLHWYKTTEENNILQLLQSKGIHTVNQLQNLLLGK